MWQSKRSKMGQEREHPFSRAYSLLYWARFSQIIKDYFGNLDPLMGCFLNFDLQNIISATFKEYVGVGL